MRSVVTTTDRIDFNAFVERESAFTAFETAEQISRRDLDEMLNEALIESFPASDPTSSLQLA